MCPNPLSGGGGSSASQSASSSAQSVQVNVSTPVNISTADLADAIKALSSSQLQAAQTTSHEALIGQVVAAGATVQAAQIAANAQPSLYVIGAAIVAALGLAFTAGLIKLPRGLRA